MEEQKHFSGGSYTQGLPIGYRMSVPSKDAGGRHPRVSHSLDTGGYSLLSSHGKERKTKNDTFKHEPLIGCGKMTKFCIPLCQRVAVGPCVRI